MDKRVKVGIIGIGHVGTHVLYSLVDQGGADEIVLIDSNQAKAKSEAQDVFDAQIYHKHKTDVYVGDFKDLKDCDVLIHCAGKITLLIESQNRDSELFFTTEMVRSYIPKIKESGFNGILINITNPCDVITEEFAKGLQLPPGHIFGTGTGLDTARLKAQLSKRTGINANAFTAFMIGEHGNAQFCPWSVVNVQGRSFEQLQKEDERFNFDPDEISNAAKEGGWVTFSGKHCTEYAIAATAVRDAIAVIHDEKIIMPASTHMQNYLGESDVFAGVPCVIGKDGVEEIIELPLNEAEKQRFHECLESIRANVKKVNS